MLLNMQVLYISSRGWLAKLFGPGTVWLSQPMNSRHCLSVGSNIRKGCRFLINLQFGCQFFHTWIGNSSTFGIFMFSPPHAASPSSSYLLHPNSLTSQSPLYQTLCWRKVDANMSTMKTKKFSTTKKHWQDSMIYSGRDNWGAKDNMSPNSSFENGSSIWHWKSLQKQQSLKLVYTDTSVIHLNIGSVRVHSFSFAIFHKIYYIAQVVSPLLIISRHKIENVR